jgi:metal-responsive CopG/Arc/MetJ family transcriptional regulator
VRQLIINNVMNMVNASITVTLPVELVNLLDDRAKRAGLSRSCFLKQMAADFLKKCEIEEEAADWKRGDEEYKKFLAQKEQKEQKAKLEYELARAALEEAGIDGKRP